MEGKNKYNDLFNNYIKEVSNNNPKHNHHKSLKKNNKNNNLDNNKINKNKKKEENEKIIEIKLFYYENDLLKKKLIEKDNILKDYKNKCKQQEEKIKELRNKISEINEQNKNKREFKNENIINFINLDDNINDDFEKQIDIKDVERKISKDLSFKNEKESNKNISSILDGIETVNFNIYNSDIYQCGICMDNFQNEEKIKKLSCGHIYHNECLNQWIQSNNKCPFCEEIIYYK